MTPMRVKVSCINWGRPGAPHAAIWIPPIDRDGTKFYVSHSAPTYFATHPEAVAYADMIARHLVPQYTHLLARSNGATA